jgi:hypothetical protein
MSSARQCPQCAATVDLPADRLADRCAFCDAPLVDIDADAEAIEHVVPFTLSRERALDRLRTHRARQRWAPEALRTGPPTSLEGILVPFYVFDGSARSTYEARIGLTAPGRSGRRKDGALTWFPVTGTHVATYHRQLVSGSRGLPEREANALEPFDLGHALPWHPALAAGWIAERPNVDHATADQVAAREVAARENDALVHTFLLGDRRDDVRNKTSLSITRAELALLPVWVATWRHGGGSVRLLVNGQTGEAVGQLPRSRLKVVVVLLLVLLPFLLGAAVAFLVALLVLPR